jgi:hypothetical protein
MYNDIGIGIITIAYIVYVIGMNWMYIKEYTTKGVIKRGNEWPE